MSKKRNRSLTQWAAAKKVEACVVCQKLPVELERQFAGAAKSRNVTVEQGLAWLREEYGIKISKEQWSLHARGRHRL